MRQELSQTSRDFGFCVTVTAVPQYVNYWSKYCSSYRFGPDSACSWDNFVELCNSYTDFISTSVRKGHFFDLDMLDMGTCDLFTVGKKQTEYRYTEDEQIMLYSLRAFMASPIQISSRLEHLTEFEMSVYCNEEVIAINQDIAFDSAKPILIIEKGEKCFRAYKRKLAGGSYAIMVMNLGEITDRITIWLEEKSLVRDVWAKKDLGETEAIDLRKMPPHTVRIFKVFPL